MSADDLLEALATYRDKVNNSERVWKMILNWEPHVVLRAKDSSNEYFVKFDQQRVSEVNTGRPDKSDHLIEIEGDYSELLSIFTGNTNPAHSFLNGNLSVFSSDKDQVKLDAISLVIWGI